MSNPPRAHQRCPYGTQKPFSFSLSGFEAVVMLALPEARPSAARLAQVQHHLWVLSASYPLEGVQR